MNHLLNLSGFRSLNGTRRTKRHGAIYAMGFKVLLICLGSLLLAPKVSAAVITVNTASEPANFNQGITLGQLGSTITFRDAFNAAANSGGNHTIAFHPSLAGQTIFLSHISTQFFGDEGSALATPDNQPAGSITIQGLTGSSGITIAAASAVRLFLLGNPDSSVTFNDLTLTGGRPPHGKGGAILTFDQSAFLNRCTLSGNTADYGGAIAVQSPLALFIAINCTIANNTAREEGGGIHSNISTPQFLNCTITGNSADKGGGLAVRNGPYPLLINTIIAGNNVAHGAWPDIGEIQISIVTQVDPASHHNLTSADNRSYFTTAGGMTNGVNGNIVGVNALLGPLADNGGPTKTCALLPGSPAINAGSGFNFIGDQRQISRPQGIAWDIGAYEFQGTPPGFTSANSAMFVTDGRQSSFAVTASGSPPPVITASGTLPPGVTLSSSGVLSGRPPAGLTGVYSLELTAANGFAPNAAQTFQLTLQPPALAITSESSASFVLLASNAFRFSSSIDPQAAFSTAQTLPAGVTLSASGLLSGTPGEGTSGTYPLVITAQGLGQTVTQNFTLTVGDLRPLVGDPIFFNIKSSTASLEAVINNPGGSPVTKYGLLYARTSVNPNPRVGGIGVTELDSPNPLQFAFITQANSLAPSTQYSLVAFAENSYGHRYSIVTNFTTLAGPIGSLVVNTLLDVTNAPGLNSLRDAIFYAYQLTEVATITFDPGLFANGPAMLTLAANALNYNPIFIQGLGGKLTIRGPGPSLLTVSGGGYTPIFNNGGPDVEMTDMTLANGSAGSSYGGAIITAANLVCSNLVFTSNRADLGGGAIYSLGPLTLRNCTFANNSSRHAGGAVSAQQGLVVSGCTFVNNQSGIDAAGVTTGYTGAGGAIHSIFGFYGLSVINSTLVSNRVYNGSGGAVCIGSGSGPNLLILNSTVAANTADVAGGGIKASSDTNFALQVRNTIISGNAAPTNPDLDGADGSYTATSCLVGVNVASIFGGNALANNGGPTPTIALNPAGPAVNAGNNVLIPAGVTTDQRGQPRINTGAADIGAYEFPFAPLAFTSADNVTFAVGASAAFPVTFGGHPSPVLLASGTFPTGVTLGSDGLLSGTPAAGTAGTYPIVLTLSNGAVANVTQHFTLSVLQPATAGPVATLHFSYTGTTRTWVVPAGVTSIDVSVIGGKGGNAIGQVGGCGTGGAIGGKGGSVTATLPITPGALLNVVVAGNGGDGCGSGPGAGGFGGGGTGGVGFRERGGGGGGGASQVSSGGTPLVLAAGGGGAGSWEPGGDAGQPGRSGTGGSFGGGGGGAGTLNGGGVGGFGTRTAGGIDGATGTAGQGGAGGAAPLFSGGGGGGAGFYGGGGGQGSNGGDAGGGGGGSSYSSAPSPVYGLDTTGVPVATIRYTLPVGSYQSLVVSTHVDEDDANSDPRLGTGTSLREALAYAGTLGGTPAISFLPSLFNAGPVTFPLVRGPLILASSVSVVGPRADFLKLSGNQAGRIAHVMPGVTASLAGLTLADGRVDHSDPFVGSGGAIKNEGTLTVTGCVFTNNEAGLNFLGHGGAIFNLGQLELVSSVLSGNRATNGGWGGAVHSHLGSVTYLSTTFSENSAGANGGAATSFGAEVAITNSTFSGNRASSGGALLHSSGAGFTMVGSTVRDNVAGSGGGYGGGVWLDQGPATFMQNTFHHNRSTGGNGGAIANLGALIAITNCTFAHNSAFNGGAVIHYANGLTLTHCTVMHNEASFSGGGIERVGRVANPFHLINTLVASNSAAFGPDAYSYLDLNEGAFTSLGHNLIANADGAIGFTHGVNGDLIGTPAAILPTYTGALQDNGGPTWTISLSANSPAVDAGLAIAELALDQRDAARAQGLRPDIGAYEFIGTPPLFASGPVDLRWSTSLPQSYTFTAQSVPASTFTVSGSLPAGLNLSSSGVLSGTPADGSGGSYTFSVVADNGYPPSASMSVTLQIVEREELMRDLRFRADGLGWVLSDHTRMRVDDFSLQLESAGDMVTSNAAWFAYPVNITAFNASFRYYLSGSESVPNAGTAFVLHNDSRGTSALGGGGTALGFSVLTPSVAILINHFTNAAGGRGIDLGIHGAATSSAFHRILPVDFVGNNTVTFKLTYYNGILQLRVVDEEDEPRYITNLPINIPAVVGGTHAWVGFTGSSEPHESGSQSVAGFRFHRLTPGTAIHELLDRYSLASDQEPLSVPLLAWNDTITGAYPFRGNGSYGYLYRFGIDDEQIQDLVQFTSALEGVRPAGAMAISGNHLFGAAQLGGALDGGAIYRINATTTNKLAAGFTNLHSFNYESEGGGPSSGVIVSGATLFGTLEAGGPSLNGGIYKMGLDGNGFTMLHTFPTVGAESPTGRRPSGALAIEGNTLYGTTKEGGANNAGVVYKLQADGTGFTVLHHFGGELGRTPVGSLVVSGNHLFGACRDGGSNDYGLLFRINTDGSEFTVLHHFVADPTDGAFPEAGLLLAGADLIGTTSRGGKHEAGTVFKLKTDGSGYALLHEFDAINGAYPNAVLAAVRNHLYGTTRGFDDLGSLYSLAIAETPSLMVTTTNDFVDAYDQLTSLREAVAYAATLPGPQTVTFSPTLAGQTVVLNQPWDWNKVSSALSVSTALTVQGPTTAPGLTLTVAPGLSLRHFLVEGSGQLTLSHLTLTGGRAPDYGGSVWSFGTLTVRSCTFTGNHAGSEGGAIQSWGGSPSCLLENSTFSGNTTASIGSAMDLGAVQTTLRHVTITSNGPGQAVVLWQTQATLQNSLIGGNDGEALGFVNGGAFASATCSNNVIASTGAIGLIDGVNGNRLGVGAANLRLGPLADNGGPTRTHALLPGSPAVNGGITLAGLTTDQRGTLRPQFGVVDLGAFEQTPFDNGQIVVQSGGARWYVGPDAIGNDLHIYREVPGQVPVAVEGAARFIGQLNDGTVVVQNANGEVFARLGSTEGLGSTWRLLGSVTAGDGATWFLSSENYATDSYYIYRWAPGGAPTYSGGAGQSLSRQPDGTVLTRTPGGGVFLRIGSSTGFGSIWQLVVVDETPARLTNPVRLADGTVSFQFTGRAGATFTAYATTEITRPLAQWTHLGQVSENPPGSGQFQFTDPQAANSSQRFYRVTSP